MNWLKAKLFLEVISNPSLWIRLYEMDADFDAWLWDALDRKASIKLNQSKFSKEIYTCEIEGVSVWIENAPYADAAANSPGNHRASRVTALRLRKIVQPMIKKLSRFVPPSKTQEYYMVNGEKFYIIGE